METQRVQNSQSNPKTEKQSRKTDSAEATSPSDTIEQTKPTRYRHRTDI